jgi:hypothetical protein
VQLFLLYIGTGGWDIYLGAGSLNIGNKCLLAGSVKILLGALCIGDARWKCLLGSRRILSCVGHHISTAR